MRLLLKNIPADEGNSFNLVASPRLRHREYVLEVRVDGQEFDVPVSVEDPLQERLLVEDEGDGVWSMWVIGDEPDSLAWIHFYARIYDEVTQTDPCDPQGSWPVEVRGDGVGLLRMQPDADDPPAVYYAFSTEPGENDTCGKLAFSLL